MKKYYSYNIIEWVEHTNYVPRQYGAAVLCVAVDVSPDEALKTAQDEAETLYGLNVTITDFRQIG